MTEGIRAKAALLAAIAKLDEAGALAVYNALGAHVENESVYVEELEDSSSADCAAEAKTAAQTLEPVASVVRACDVAIYG